MHVVRDGNDGNRTDEAREIALLALAGSAPICSGGDTAWPGMLMGTESPPSFAADRMPQAQFVTFTLTQLNFPLVPCDTQMSVRHKTRWYCVAGRARDVVTKRSLGHNIRPRIRPVLGQTGPFVRPEPFPARGRCRRASGMRRSRTGSFL